MADFENHDFLFGFPVFWVSRSTDSRVPIRAIDAAPAMILDKSAAMIIQTGRFAVILHDRLLPAKTAAMKCNVSNCGGVA